MAIVNSFHSRTHGRGVAFLPLNPDEEAHPVALVSRELVPMAVWLFGKRLNRWKPRNHLLVVFDVVEACP